MLGACLLVGARTGRVVGALATAGTMPLTVYVGHALLYPRLAPVLGADLVTATLVGAGVVVVAVASSNAWARTGRRRGTPRRGPVEELMRRVSAAGTPARPGPR